MIALIAQSSAGQESSLSLKHTSLYKAVSHFLFGELTAGNLSTKQDYQVTLALDSGIRDMLQYNWTFMKPWTELDTENGTWVYELPAIFGGMIGDRLFFETEDARFPVTLRGVGDVMQARVNSSESGYPRIAAIRPKHHAIAVPQRFELLLFPTPDAAYTLTYRYQANVDAITSSGEWPPGGMNHSETILGACLMAAEVHVMNMPGVHTDRYPGLLGNSIERDGRVNAANIGMMQDHSDGDIDAYDRRAVRELYGNYTVSRSS